MSSPDASAPILFSLDQHPLVAPLGERLQGATGNIETRQFPDGETYLRVTTSVTGADCVVVTNLVNPNEKFLPLLFLLGTLRELGARSVGVVAPYLCYMRQDKRFHEGEALTSRLFARALSQHMDWLVTVDPHLHRYHALQEIYTVPSRKIEGAHALAEWLQGQSALLLVGPDAESEQWVAEVAAASGHPYVIGEKHRYGDRQVEIHLPDIRPYRDRTAVVIDDVISSGQTILKCLQALQKGGIDKINCAAVHGIFADGVDDALMRAGLGELVTCNTIPHKTNRIDVTPLLAPAIQSLLTGRPG